ncbi:MAG: hypothetical protein RLZ10_1790 [Bacteroidota bacterium]|jgi:hypothetical protein
MTKQELKNLIKEVINEIGYESADKSWLSNYVREGNNYISLFVSEVYKDKNISDLKSHFKKIVAQLESGMKSRLRKNYKSGINMEPGEYDKINNAIELYKKAAQGEVFDFKKSGGVGGSDVRDEIRLWIRDEYPDHSVGGVTEFGQNPKTGYAIQGIMEKHNKDMKSLATEFINWYKENV